MIRTSILIILFSLATACVKDDGKVSGADSTAGGTTGTTSGGSSTGAPSSGLTDPLASEAWHLDNTGSNKSFSSTAGLAGNDINVKEVHADQKILGKNIRIAVSDSGVDILHADLAPNALTGEHRNYTAPTQTDWIGGTPMPVGDEAHGTSVTGLAAAVGWNGIGSRGVAPLAKFAGFRFIYGASSDTTASLKAKEIDQLNGDFDIFNYSYGKSGIYFVEEDDDVSNALKLGINTLRNGKGANYVQAAGNWFAEQYYYCDPAGPGGPACLFHVTGNANSHETLATPYKIVVGAINAIAEKSSYSSPGSNLWVSAPGGEYGYSSPAMVSTDISGCNLGFSKKESAYAQYFDFGFNPLNLQCDYTNTMNGTSAATPVTSGVVALMLEAKPTLTWRDVKHILASTADKIDYDIFDNLLDHPLGYDISGYQYDEKWTLNKAGYLFSNYYGFGRVNAGAAVAMAKTYNLSTLGTFEQTLNNAGTWFYQSDFVVPLNITDESSTPALDRIWVGHNYLVESVQVQLTIDHPFPGDLAIHLVSPKGTESRIMNLNSKIYGDSSSLDQTIMLSNAFYGEESVGYWTIKVYDGDSFVGTGDLVSWNILVSGHKKTADLNKPYPPTFITLNSVPVSNSVTPVFGFSDSASAASVFWYEAAVGLTPDDELIKGWTNIGLSTFSQQLTGLSMLNEGQTYYLKLRARSAGGYSSVQVKSWTADTP